MTPLVQGYMPGTSAIGGAGACGRRCLKRRYRSLPSLAAAISRLSALAATLTFAGPMEAHAWGDKGHEIIALVASHLLTPTAHRQVKALLDADHDPLTAPDLAARATWADRWRDSDRNTSKVRYLGTRQWHFADVELDRPSLEDACFGFQPLPAGKVASEGPAQACVVDKVEQFARELGDPAAARAEKILAFKFLLHFVGDLHQPLHAADHHDSGGNAVMVLEGGQAVARPLHAYWDTTVVEKLGQDPQAVADAILTGAENETAEWSAGTPRTWAMETFGVARDVAYRLPASTVTDTASTPAYRLDVTYEIPAVDAARQQLGRAGVRLAVLLNAALR